MARLFLSAAWRTFPCWETTRAFYAWAPPRDSDFDRAVPCLLGGKSAELCFQPALAVQGQKKKNQVLASEISRD